MDWTRLPLVGILFGWVRTRMKIGHDHDVQIFKNLDSIANESRIDNILRSSIYTSHLSLQELRQLEAFTAALGRTENSYLNSTVQLRAEELRFEMNKLLDLVMETFSSAKPEVLGFYPRLIDRTLYDSKWAELNKNIDKVLDAYRTYRTSLKKHLSI